MPTTNNAQGSGQQNIAPGGLGASLGLSFGLSGDSFGPVTQRLSGGKRGDRNYTFQVGSGLSAKTGSSSASDGGAVLPDSLPWLIVGAAAFIAWLIVRGK